MDRYGVSAPRSYRCRYAISSGLKLRHFSTMVATIVIKGIVWVWCSRIPSTAVKALAQDAENDGKFKFQRNSFGPFPNDMPSAFSVLQHHVPLLPRHRSMAQISLVGSNRWYGPEYIHHLAMVHCKPVYFTCSDRRQAC